jgi:hypothetical protein
MAILDINTRLPKYTITFPIKNVKVEFRPFTVKEEKILLLAQEDNNKDAIIDSINQIIVNCTFNKYSVNDLNKIDAEFLFIHMRNKSKGEGVDIRAICKECGHKTPMTMNFENIKVTNLDYKQKPIQILDDVWVTLKYPTIKESIALDSENGIEAIAMALDTIIEGETVKSASDYSMEERIEFVESLTNMQLAKFKPFFENFPLIVLDINYTCKCGVENDIHVEGIENFFD